MTLRSSTKSQSDLLDIVRKAGWKEDQKSSLELRWFDPKEPGIYFTLRDAAALIRARRNSVRKQDVLRIQPN